MSWLFLLLGLLGNEALGGEHEASHRRRVLQRRTHDLGRIDDADLDEVLVLFGGGVEAECAFAALDLLDDDRAIDARVGGNLAQRFLDSATDDRCTDLLIALQRLDERVDGNRGANQRHTASGDDAFFDGRAGRVQSILDARLLLLHLALGSSAHLDDSHATDDLREALLQLLAVVVGGRVFDLGADLLHAGLDVGLLACSLDDGAVVLVDGNALGAAEILERHAFELDA